MSNTPLDAICRLTWRQLVHLYVKTLEHTYSFTLPALYNAKPDSINKYLSPSAAPRNEHSRKTSTVSREEYQRWLAQQRANARPLSEDTWAALRRMQSYL